MRSLVLAVLLAVAAIAAPSAALGAQATAQTRLYIHTGPDPSLTYGHLRYGGRDWKAITTLLQSTFAITTGNTLPALDVLAHYDALWIDQRYGAQPTTTDMNTMLAFAATGKRVVIVGENSSGWDLNFLKWSAPWVQALGGVQGSGNNTTGVPGNYIASVGCVYGAINTIFTHALTSNVASINVGCSGYAIGGTALFDYNAVTLWGTSSNVLTILDTNILDDYPWGPATDTPQFRNNLMSWLDASAVTTVPEPATYALLAPALLAIAVVVRRRRSRTS
jgi:hypothetical protein